MIACLKGELFHKTPEKVIIMVNGVGYDVFLSAASLERLPPLGEEVFLHAYTYVREDTLSIFGFMDADEKAMFLMLIGVSGVGPKLAVSALSGLPVRELKNALINGDIKRISSISGIGKKTAERIVIELRDKFDQGEQLDAFASPDTAPGDNRLRDAALALTALGQKPDDATKMITGVAKKLTPDMTVEDLIRLALTK